MYWEKRSILILPALSVLSFSVQIRLNSSTAHTCVFVCSQVCQCTVNSSTRRAPGTDEWGQRSAALWDHYILRSRDPRPPQNTDIKGSPLHSQKSLFPSHPALCVFLECVWLYVKSFALIGSRCLICAVVQASFSPHIWCHVKSADWQLEQLQHQQTPRARERPCLHVQIEELDSWVKSFQHRLLMISNNFCSSAWVQVEQLWSAIQKHPRPGKADTCDECCCFSIFDQCSGNTWCTLLCWRDDVVWF